MFDLKKAEYLYHFAFDCIDQEYPNKTGHVLGDGHSAFTPRALHPAFYGCFDWHSSVHGHWTLVNILRIFPDFEHYEAILDKLVANLTKSNILAETAYFEDKNNLTFERTYGWAWLFKLKEALSQWDHPRAREMEANLQPLVDTLEVKLIQFLPKLTYPIRVGEHSNTAIALSLSLDYARTLKRELLEDAICTRAKEYYMGDRDCPIGWEPSGFDFLSPCLQEASLMSKVLPPEDFSTWLADFLPELATNPDKLLQPAKVSDRSDGKLAHLDGLNFSRAWCLYEIGHVLDNTRMLASAADHFNYSYHQIDSEEYAGSHWLASFALYALLTENP